MNPFAEKYKTLGNAKLLEIINNPQNYQRLAIDAAEAELAVRGLNDAQLAVAEAELQAEADEEKVRAEKREQVNNRLKNGTIAIIRSFRPWQLTSARSGRVILFICIVQFIISLKLLWDGIANAIFAINVRHHLPSVNTGLMLLIPIFSLGATYLFMRGKRTGWMLLSTYLVFINLVWFAAAASYIVFILHEGFLGGQALTWAGIAIAEAAFSTPCTWYVYKKWMRDLYEIDRFWQVSTICIGFLCWVALYLQVGI